MRNKDNRWHCFSEVASFMTPSSSSIEKSAMPQVRFGVRFSSMHTKVHMRMLISVYVAERKRTDEGNCLNFIITAGSLRLLCRIVISSLLLLIGRTQTAGLKTHHQRFRWALNRNRCHCPERKSHHKYDTHTI